MMDIVRESSLCYFTLFDCCGGLWGELLMGQCLVGGGGPTASSLWWCAHHKPRMLSGGVPQDASSDWLGDECFVISGYHKRLGDQMTFICDIEGYPGDDFFTNRRSLGTKLQFCVGAQVSKAREESLSGDFFAFKRAGTD